MVILVSVDWLMPEKQNEIMQMGFGKHKRIQQKSNYQPYSMTHLWADSKTIPNQKCHREPFASKRTTQMASDNFQIIDIYFLSLV